MFATAQLVAVCLLLPEGFYRAMLCPVRNDLAGFEMVFVHPFFIGGVIAVTVTVIHAAAQNLLRPRPKSS